MNIHDPVIQNRQVGTPQSVLSKSQIYNAFAVAYQEAIKARELDEVPVGACLVFQDQIIASAHNQIRTQKDPTAHAELEVIRLAARKMNNERLNDCILFSTLEPCALCGGGIILARIKEVHFLAFEERIPALRQILSLEGHNHKPVWEKHEIEEFPASELLRNFFREKRIR